MIPQMGERVTLDKIVDLATDAEQALGAGKATCRVKLPLLHQLCMELLERRAADMNRACGNADLAIDAMASALDGNGGPEPLDAVALVEGSVEIMRRAQAIAAEALEEARRRT
jgi:hypothetical protein